MFLLPYLGGNQQAGCEWYNSSSQEGFREKGESFRGKGGKMATKGYTLPLQTQTPYRSRPETKWMVKDERHQVSPKCS